MTRQATEGCQAHGIVLAGPRDLGELSRFAPRPLLPVAQQPLIAYVLRWMRKGGLRSVTVCSNSTSRAVRDRVHGSAVGMDITHLEDFSPRGPAGCVRDAAARVDAGLLVVADATALPTVDLRGLLEAHRSAGAAMTVVVAHESSGRLRPTGAYVMASAVCGFVPDQGFHDIKEQLIPRLYAAGLHVRMHVADAVAPRVFDAQTYLAANEWAITRAVRAGEPLDGFEAREGALVHASASVEDVRLLGPVLVGPGASVRCGATLVGPVTIGAGSRVDQGAVVSRSVVAGGCVIGAGAFVDRSILGDGARVDPRSVLFSAVQVAQPAAERPSWPHPGRLARGAIRMALGFPASQSS